MGCIDLQQRLLLVGSGRNYLLLGCVRFVWSFSSNYGYIDSVYQLSIVVDELDKTITVVAIFYEGN